MNHACSCSKLLSDTERTAAIAAVRPLRDLGPNPRLRIGDDSMRSVARDCVEAVSHLKQCRNDAVDRLFSETLELRALGIDCEASVPVLPSFDGGPEILVQLGRQLGVDGWEPTPCESSTLHANLRFAAAYIRDFSEHAARLTAQNTGIIRPFRCAPPVSGSSSALQLPGVLLLPVDVPALILAEYWLHECLHTELYLAEWYEGVAPARSEALLDTPWREVQRPASMLLHGSFVFSCIALFMRRYLVEYESSCAGWHLSATPGQRVPYASMNAAIGHRIAQVNEALKQLRKNAAYSEIGARAANSCEKVLEAACQ